jgi:hypothetical protein
MWARSGCWPGALGRALPGDGLKGVLTEGFNNKIKLIQRMAYGLRNEHNR